MSNLCWSSQERFIKNPCNHARATKIVTLTVILITKASVLAGTMLSVQEQPCQFISMEEATPKEDYHSNLHFLKVVWHMLDILNVKGVLEIMHNFKILYLQYISFWLSDL